MKDPKAGIKILGDSALPPDKAPQAGSSSGAGGLEGGLGAAKAYLMKTVKNQSKMHECCGTPSMAGSPK